MSDRELHKGLVQDNIKYSQVELGRLVMGSRRRLNKKTSWESTSLPVRNPLQPRPFGKGIQARRAELPTTNVLQTRPFGTPKQASSPKQEMPDLQAQLKQAESFGYNAANIPTVPSSNATPIQAKLTIGEPNDKYEQEADQVASQVVNQINSPQSQPSVQGKTVQREALPEEEEEETPLSAKLESGTLQRETLPPEEEEETPLSAKLESGTLQRETLPPEEEEETPLSAKLESGTLQRETLPPEEEEETPLSAKLESGTLQRETLPPEEEEETPLSAKLESGTLQRETLPPEEEEETPLSAKLESGTLQRQGISPEEEEKKKISLKLMRKSQSGTGSTNSSVNLEESIQQKRGQGQSLSEDIREPMEQAFGADFSGVKVHTDSQSDQLNRSIQARAFTTGSDVFFKQGEYNPGSKDGQELLAHELTHVVQQNPTQSVQTKLIPSPDSHNHIIRRVLYQKGDPKGATVPSGAKTLASQVSSAKKIQVQVGKKKLNGFQIGNNQYVGDRPYKNLSGDLPSGVTYIEYDIYPYTGKNRGSDRIVIGSDGKRYYTNNHYTDFTEF
ncbi:hypothetical protein MC7420_3968 [Coleofasciculus chthonoplastes PCC 7420]|uniref:eCIS core domain-containing protein n=1 Tax=Coleofasciculus chthonoplastes PCC 7420 TaxID=118168 RepID=B4VU95_9CYAN|nr:DUF4157 domain-containing protein [Coleofasciculus chthonoplastes]EDX74444.1 hypothetical protein MC7420_3968 [Coleofasciculus chthonoplastes PCC 7420]